MMRTARGQVLRQGAGETDNPQSRGLGRPAKSGNAPPAALANPKVLREVRAPSRVRDFGKLRSVTLNTVAFIAITGNGLIISQDLVRRVIEIHLDAFMEHPEQRQFAVKDDDFIIAVGNRRTELMVALLTVWRWGRQNALAPGLALGSYGQWCSWARDPLLALGCTDPIERIVMNKQRDPARQSIMQIFDAWRKRHGDRPVAVADLHDEVRFAIDPQNRGRQYRTAYLTKLAGTRTGGYVLTQQSPAGKWGQTTYRLAAPTAGT